MNSALFIIAVIWFIASTVAIAALTSNLNALRELINAQDDVIAHIGSTLNDQVQEMKKVWDTEFESMGHVADLSNQNSDLADRIDQLAKSLAYQQKLIDRVRAYAYNEATRNEPVDL